MHRHVLSIDVHLGDHLSDRRDEQIRGAFAADDVDVVAAGRDNIPDVAEMFAFIGVHRHVEEIEVIIRALGKFGEFGLGDREELSSKGFGLGSVRRGVQFDHVCAFVGAREFDLDRPGVEIQSGTGSESIREIGVGLDFDVAAQSPCAGNDADDDVVARRRRNKSLVGPRAAVLQTISSVARVPCLTAATRSKTRMD